MNNNLAAVCLVLLIAACGRSTAETETAAPAPNGQYPAQTLVPSPELDASAMAPALPQDGPVIGGCPVLPKNHILNRRVDDLPVHPLSDAYVASIGLETGLHPDFGSGLWEGRPIGIPYNLVNSSTPGKQVRFEYDAESDQGLYPIPENPLIEGGPEGDGDRHILMLDTDTCVLFELYHAYPYDQDAWIAGSGAIFDLRSNALRPAGWTSADAAGLPIFPVLVRYEEVAAGEIRHAIRFTASRTQAAYTWPARHLASDITPETIPPMGQRFRLKASFDRSSYPPEVQVILLALQRYGLILADNGSDWYLTGAPDERWDNEMLHLLNEVKGSDFEAVDVGGVMIDPDSGQAAP